MAGDGAPFVKISIRLAPPQKSVLSPLQGMLQSVAAVWLAVNWITPSHPSALLLILWSTIYIAPDDTYSNPIIVWVWNWNKSKIKAYILVHPQRLRSPSRHWRRTACKPQASWLHCPTWRSPWESLPLHDHWMDIISDTTQRDRRKDVREAAYRCPTRYRAIRIGYLAHIRMRYGYSTGGQILCVRTRETSWVKWTLSAGKSQGILEWVETQSK